MTTSTTDDNRLHDLERLLLRISIIMEEAEGRQITNRALICQLNLLRKEMYREYFNLDTLRYHRTEVQGYDVSHSFSHSELNNAKHRFLSTTDSHREEELQQVIEYFNNIIEDANGLVVFLRNYPPLYRQPYSAHLLIGKCMFGRQMEMDTIMDFLFRKEHLDVESVAILPIVGPTHVGKSTLVAHVYNDARVRSYFSRILLFTGDDINRENIATLKDCGMIMHRSSSSITKDDRVLSIIEFSSDADEVSWNKFYSSYRAYLGRHIKIIITSRSNKIIKFGTTQGLALNFLPPEAYWYFFKILIFGSVYSVDHPVLESIAMEIARRLRGSFMGANKISAMLQKQFVSQHWKRCLGNLNKNIQWNVSLFGQEPFELVNKNKAISMQISDDEFAVTDNRRACLVNENHPVITIEDVLCKRIKYAGEFQVLLWKSHVLPYSSYAARCTIEKLQ